MAGLRFESRVLLRNYTERNYLKLVGESVIAIQARVRIPLEPPPLDFEFWFPFFSRSAESVWIRLDTVFRVSRSAS